MPVSLSQVLKRHSYKVKIVGSNPTAGTFFGPIAQLVRASRRHREGRRFDFCWDHTTHTNMPTKSYTPQEQAFIDFVKDLCKKNGITPSLRNSKYVKLSPKIRCSGWFDSESRILVVSMNHKDWIEILAHEYSHMTQWLDKIPLWNIATDSLELVDLWLAGETIDDIEEHINNSRDLELDNEKRTVEVIKKFGLSCDIDLYIKKCNAYILFYNYIKESRKWSKPGNGPYSNKKILDLMSSEFDMDYSELTKEIRDTFISENI